MTINVDRIVESFLKDFIIDEQSIRQANIKFCHYTSAANALLILKNQELWLRQPHCMNDLSELRHGLNRFNIELETQRTLFENGLNEIHEDLYLRLVAKYKDSQTHAELNHFVFCMTEHEEENAQGKLSMWRAYGGDAGVCIVFKTDVFIDEVTSPEDEEADTPNILRVRYTKGDVVKQWFNHFCLKLKEHKLELNQLEPDYAAMILSHIIQMFVLSSKHEAFDEEREWRVVFTDKGDPASYLKRETEIIASIPQEIYKIDLLKVPLGQTKLTINDLIDYILIGPTQYPVPIYQSLVHELKLRGVENSEARVKITGIPLRTSR